MFNINLQNLEITKKLFILALVLMGSMTIANAQVEAESVTFTYQNAHGEQEEFTAEGYTVNLPCCGEVMNPEWRDYESDCNKVPILVTWRSNSSNGWGIWFGCPDETVGESGLYGFLMDLLAAI